MHASMCHDVVEPSDLMLPFTLYRVSPHLIYPWVYTLALASVFSPELSNKNCFILFQFSVPYISQPPMASISYGLIYSKRVLMLRWNRIDIQK